jgi:hypothetical protein
MQEPTGKYWDGDFGDVKLVEVISKIGQKR